MDPTRAGDVVSSGPDAHTRDINISDSLDGAALGTGLKRHPSGTSASV